MAGLFKMELKNSNFRVIGFRLLTAALIWLTLTAVTSGCSSLEKLWDDIFESTGSEVDLLPQDLAYDGMDHLKAKRYDSAIEAFQKLKDRYPYSKYAILAELKIADAMYLKGNYLEAQAAYQDFEQLHPRNEAVPYVIYQQGMCYFNLIAGPDRDQTPTVRSIQTFTRLADSFPESRYAAMALARITEAQNSLAGHEFNVGEFYYNSREYKAAMGRFVSLVKNYPDTGYHLRALDYIRICRQKLDEMPPEVPEETEVETTPSPDDLVTTTPEEPL